MPDPRFFETLSPLTVGEACKLAGADLVFGDGQTPITRVADIAETSLDGAIVFAGKHQALATLTHRVCGLCLTTPDAAGILMTDGKNPFFEGALGLVADPKAAFSRVAGRLHASRTDGAVRADAAGKSHAPQPHETAIVADTAVIGAGAVIGPHVFIGPYAVIGTGVEIGARTRIGAGAVISHAIIGEDAVVAPGAVIGEAGFGFVADAGGLSRSPQLGIVRIGDRVEIGSNTTIDRGALGDTVIGADTKIDNLVQIGHNVKVGRGCVMASMVGVSGSTTIGDGVFVGGQVGIADHLAIGDGAQLAARAGVMKNVPAGEKWGGFPARPVRQWLRETAHLEKSAKKK